MALEKLQYVAQVCALQKEIKVHGSFVRAFSEIFYYSFEVFRRF